MKKLKFWTTLYSASAIGISLYGIMRPSYYMNLLVNPGTPYLLLRISVVLALLAYAFLPRIRTTLTKPVLQTLGVAILSLGVLMVMSPNLYGYLGYYSSIGDMVILLEGGILALLLGIELPARRSLFVTNNYTHMKSLIAAQPGQHLLDAAKPRTKTPANA